MSELTHLDSSGRARMVDVGDKSATERRAVARRWSGSRRRPPRRVAAGDAPKGDVLGVARIAGIQAAKRTSELIPLCHPLRAVVRRGRGRRSTRRPARSVLIAEARTHRTHRGRDGGAHRRLRRRADVYDMVKGIERGAEIAEVVLLEKSGGRSGVWKRP